MVTLNIGEIEVKKWNYFSGKYASENYGSHTQAIRIGGLTLYFSYDTVIGFCFNGNSYYRHNDWGTTTGKHLNYLCPDKRSRLKDEVFDKLLQKALTDFKWLHIMGE